MLTYNLGLVIQVHEQLQLSYKNTDELNKIIDDKLPSRQPAFRCFEASIGGEKFIMFCRNLLECAKALWADTEHVRYLVVAPERHYADEDQMLHLYHDLHTGEWWWATQVCSCIHGHAIQLPF